MNIMLDCFYKEVTVDTFSLIAIDTKNKTYTIKNVKECEIPEFADVVSALIFDVLVEGLKSKGYSEE